MESPVSDGRTGHESSHTSVRLQLIAATVIVWGANFLILTARSIMEGGVTWPQMLPARILLTAIGLALCYAMHRVFSRFRDRMSRQLIAAIIMLPLATELYAWSSATIAFSFFGVPIRSFDGETLLQLATILWLFATWCGLYLSITYGWRLREQERKAHAERLLAKTAQLQALRYQVNPHFLFNSLNAISALISDNRRTAAERMVESLSRFLRTTLHANDDLDVRLSEELALQQAYLEVEQARFPDLELTIDVPEEAGTVLVPSLILQPLVENAIKHGIAIKTGRASILINAWCDGKALRVTVSNDTSKSNCPIDTGIGLANVERRLTARYGGAGRLSTRLTPSSVFEAEIVLPISRGS